jgi:hypothetical protein
MASDQQACEGNRCEEASWQATEEVCLTPLCARDLIKSRRNLIEENERVRAFDNHTKTRKTG